MSFFCFCGIKAHIGYSGKFGMSLCWIMYRYDDFSESVTYRLFVNEIPVFSQIYAQDFWYRNHAFVYLQACLPCLESVQAAGDKSCLMRGRKYVSNTCKEASCPCRYTALTNLNAWVSDKICAARHPYGQKLEVQIQCMCLFLFMLCIYLLV